MGKVLITESILSGIADAIREKDGSTAKITPANMATQIANIPSSSGTDDVATAIVARTITEYESDEVQRVGSFAFNSCSSLTEIHFAAANQSKIEASSYYSSKWGADNATIYFDL